MTDHAQTRFWSGIDIPKTLAGTLAAVSAAVVGSFLGLAGTLIGAAVASVISSIGTEVYHRSIDRGTKRLQSAFVTAPAAVGTPEVAATHEPPSETTGEHDTERKRLNWKRIALVTAGLFVIALGSLTAVELLAGKTAADAVNGRDSGRPTLLNFSGNSETPEQREQDGTPPPETTTPATEAPATEAPATEAPATGEPTEPAQQPTENAPATEPAQPTSTQQPTGGTETGPDESGQEQSGQDGSGTQQRQEEGTGSGR